MGIYAFIIPIVILFSFNLHGKELCVNCHSEHIKSSCISCHKGNPNSMRIKIAHENIIKGEFLMYKIDNNIKINSENIINDIGCRRCHKIGQYGNTKGSDLNKSINSKNIRDLTNSILAPSDFMPDFKLLPNRITLIMNGLIANSENYEESNSKSIIYLKNKLEKNLFIEKCGNCHKVISEKLGHLGSGNIAPNLSGILSKYYPKTINLKTNSIEDIKNFIKNPRHFNKHANMPVVELSDEEMKEIIEILK